MHALLTAAVAVALAATGGDALVGNPDRAPAAGAPGPSAPPAAAMDLPPPPAVRLAVVPLDAPADLALLGRSLAEAVAQEVAKPAGFDVLGPAAVQEKLGLDGAKRVAHCGESAGCLAEPGRRLGVAFVVGGFVERAGESYRFALVLVDVRTGAAKARAAREVPIASRRIRADVVAAAGPLLRGEAAGTGTLALRTEAPGAEVRIDDQPAGRTPLEVRLPAGKHKVELLQAGKVRVEPFWVEVPANGRVEQAVRLYDIPVAERKPGEVETVVDVAKEKRRKN